MFFFFLKMMLSLILCVFTTSVMAAVPPSVLSALSNVLYADGYTYALHDDIGKSMDSVRVGLGSDGLTFIAMYHTRRCPDGHIQYPCCHIS